MKQEVKTKSAQSAPRLLSQALVVGDLVFTSGFIHVKPDGSMVEGPVKDRFEQVMKNVSEVLAAAGAELGDVVKVTIYVTDISELPEINKLYVTYFKEPLPVREAVGVKSLPLNASIEISVVAEKTFK